MTGRTAYDSVVIAFSSLYRLYLINVSGANRVSVAGYSIGDHLWSSNHSRRDNYV